MYQRRGLFRSTLRQAGINVDEQININNIIFSSAFILLQVEFTIFPWNIIYIIYNSRLNWRTYAEKVWVDASIYSDFR